MATCGNLGSNEALARDNEINRITPDPYLPPLGGPGRIENPPYGVPPVNTNAVAQALASVLPSYGQLGDRATYRKRVVIQRNF
jgi:hypothetical protein